MIRIAHHQFTKCSSCGAADRNIKVYITDSFGDIESCLCPSCIGEAARVIADAVEEKRKMQERVPLHRQAQIILDGWKRDAENGQERVR